MGGLTPECGYLDGEIIMDGVSTPLSTKEMRGRYEFDVKIRPENYGGGWSILLMHPTILSLDKL